MIDWIDCRVQMPEYGTLILGTDGLNVSILEYDFNGLFHPIKSIRGKLVIIPKFWYNLNDVELPEG